MQGGLKVYRGGAAAARHYVEADRSRADDYYLAEGTGLAQRFTASPDTAVASLGEMDGEAYEAWVAGFDPVTGAPRGRLRSDANAVRFVEVVVNGPKTWSLAAALHPEVAKAYDAAMDRAAGQVIGWLAEHATTRVGPRGRQVQVPTERIEAAVVRHYTSRAGDPHRHLHLQVNARVFAEQRWRGLHTVGVRDSLGALNGIGHAAMMTDPQFRTVLAAHGFTMDPATGELRELAGYVGAFSARTRQIGANIDRYEAQWREAHPGQEPGTRLRRVWDARAWADARPDKVVPTSGAELATRWNDELLALGYQPHPAAPLSVDSPRPGTFDREHAVEVVLARLGALRSAWNGADIRGEVERWVAGTGLVTDAAVRIELAEDLTDRATQACVPLLPGPGVPEHVRALTSPAVLAVEADLVARLARRAASTTRPDCGAVSVTGLDHAQADAAALLAGSSPMLVIEGAAGVGKTRTLAAAHEALAGRGRRMLVVTPTLKAARVAAEHVGGGAFSAAWLAHQHGWRWDEHGTWTRIPSDPAPGAVLRRGDLLVVDEAGMLDQDTARALLRIADDAGARVALVGDRHQLPAVGRGGMLDHAMRWAPPEARVSLEVIHRFADPDYAALTLAMRTGTDPSASGPGRDVGERSGEVSGEVFDALVGAGQVRIYPTEAERTHAVAAQATALQAGGAGGVVMADTRDQVAALNAAIRDRRVADGTVDDTRAVTTAAGERVGVGDLVATRRNHRDLGVANRDTWTITDVGDDGTLTVRGTGRTGVRELPAGYAMEHVELAYATTVYGAQGETSHTGHALLGHDTTGSAAYVAMTRGRQSNVAHLVAEDLDQARAQWTSVFARDPADLGPTHAAARAADDLERYGALRPLPAALGQLRAAWSTEQDLRDQISNTAERRGIWIGHGEPGQQRVAQLDHEIDVLTERLHDAIRQVEIRLREPAIRALPATRLESEHTDWLQGRRRDQQAARQAAWLAIHRPQTARSAPVPDYARPRDRGPRLGF